MLPIINQAFADGAAASTPAPAPYLDFLLIFIFVLVFYFLIWRPQSKRAQEHRQLVDSLEVGDEIITNGGVVGKIVAISGGYIKFEVAKSVEITLEKSAISTTLPKGSIKNLMGKKAASSS